MMIDEKMEPAVAKEIVRGEQDKLNSAFYLGYNMILNLMRVEGISPEFMLERCFYQFQNTASVSGLELELHRIEAEKSNLQIQDEGTVKDYYNLRKQLDLYSKDMHEVITHPNYCLPFMQPGRLVRIRYLEHDFGWGVVVDFQQRKASKTPPMAKKPQQMHIVHVLLAVAGDASYGTKVSEELPPGVRPPAQGEKGKMEVVPVLLSCIISIGQLRVFLPKDLKSAEQRQTVRKSLEEIQRRFPDGIAVLDPIENMGITDDSFKKLLRVS